MTDKVDDGLIYQPYRKAHEAIAMFGWLFLVPLPFILNGLDHSIGRLAIYATSISGFMFLINARKTYIIWQWRIRLFGGTLLKLNVEEAIEKFNKHPGYLYLGEGFEWENKHTQLVYDLEKADFGEIYPPSWFVRGYNKLFKSTYHYSHCEDEFTKKVRGLHWIHGIGLAKKKDLYMAIDDVSGNMGVTGTSRSGKTRLYDLILAQLITKPEQDTIIIIDPKSDDDLLQRIIYWAEHAGRENDLWVFDPAQASKSIRLDCMSSFNSASDLASRISPMIKSEDNFSDFVWNTLEIYGSGMLFLGIKPSINLYRYYIEKGPDELLYDSIQKLSNLTGDAWRAKLESYGKNIKPNSRDQSSKAVKSAVAYYTEELQHIHKHKIVEGLLNVFKKDRSWHSKMVASGEPVLRSLCAGDLEELLSPNVEDSSDLRPIVDLQTVVRQKKILYVRLNSLANTEVAGNLGSLLLSDLTYLLSTRYSYKDSGNHKVHLLVDESNNVFNRPFIDALNKGAGAGLRSWVAMQTTPDIEVRFQDTATKDQVLGNFNNSISLRVIDETTKKYVSDQFSTTTVNVASDKIMTSARGKDEDLIRHSGSYGTNNTPTEAPVISPSMLSNLADLQFVARVSAGRKIKGVVPIIKVCDDIENYSFERLPYVKDILRNAEAA